MDIEVANVAPAVVPYLGAVAAAYGNAVVDKVRDGVADGGAGSTVSLGRRLLQRLLHRPDPTDALGRAMTDLAENPADEDFQAALRGQVKKALSANPGRAGAGMLRDRGVSITASGDRAVAVRPSVGSSPRGQPHDSTVR